MKDIHLLNVDEICSEIKEDSLLSNPLWPTARYQTQFALKKNTSNKMILKVILRNITKTSK